MVIKVSICLLIGIIAGTKNVVKELHKICMRWVRTIDRMRFTEHSDMAMFYSLKMVYGYSAPSTMVHLYWCMRNCGGNPDRLCGCTCLCARRTTYM